MARHLLRDDRAPSMFDLQTLAEQFANLVWGTPLVTLLLGGGLFFLVVSSAAPYRYMGHAFAVLLGRYDTSGRREKSHTGRLWLQHCRTRWDLATSRRCAGDRCRGAGCRVLDVGIGDRGHRNQIFYLFTGCDVSRKRFAGRVTGRSDVRNPGGATQAFLFSCRVVFPCGPHWHAPNFSGQSTDSTHSRSRIRRHCARLGISCHRHLFGCCRGGRHFRWLAEGRQRRGRFATHDGRGVPADDALGSCQ